MEGNLCNFPDKHFTLRYDIKYPRTPGKNMSGKHFAFCKNNIGVAVPWIARHINLIRKSQHVPKQKLANHVAQKKNTLPLPSCEQNSGMYLVCDKLKKSQATKKQMFMDLAQCGWIWKRF